MPDTLQAFHNDPAVKAKYLSRVEQHITADNLIRGTGWAGGRGCAVGCTLEAYDHSRYPVELGIPEWLARVEDTLFEGMSVEKSRTWPRDFLEAIKVGADLEAAKAPFTLIILRRNLSTLDSLVVDASETDVVNSIKGSRAAVQTCIELWEQDDVGSDSWWERARSAESAARSAARSAAWSAARSAWSAAWSAARSAAWSAAWSAARSAAWSAARSAAESAESAESAARSAAESAESAESAARSAAWSAAWSAAFDFFAEQLLEILRTIGADAPN